MANRFPFSTVGALKPGHTGFNLFHSNTVDMDFGPLYPVDIIEVLPGDWFKLNVNVVGRLTSALESPILAQFDVMLEAFFVPTRLLMGSDANFEVPSGEVNWEDFLKGGQSGDVEYSLPEFGRPLSASVTLQYGGLGDYAGIQPGVALTRNTSDVNDNLIPDAFLWRGYRWIWNEFYRSEALQDEVQVCQFLGDGSTSDSTYIADDDYDTLLRRGWRRDYFTSCLPFQQFGTSPALPIEGVIPVDFSERFPTSGNITETLTYPGVSQPGVDFYFPAISGNGFTIPAYSKPYGQNVSSVTQVFAFNPAGKSGPQSYSLSQDSNPREGEKAHRAGTASVSPTTEGVVDLSDAVTFDINDVRTAWQVQKWMERNARAGVRYTEYLRSHFGVSPNDDRLQRPHFIGSFKLPWYVSEVLQTSATQDGSSAQGNQAGQAIALGSGRLGNFRAYEFGYIIVLASIKPKPQYQQGIPRLFTRKTRFDFYSPEFAHLSEQAVKNSEIFVSGNNDSDSGVFGFQGIWNELRYLPSRVSNHMRSGAPTYSYDYWHLARSFAETPVLNSEFLTIGGTSEAQTELHRIFAVQDENPFVLDFGFNFRASRPLPYDAEPGLVDHF